MTVSYDLSHSEYLAVPALGASSVRRLALQSPAHFRFGVDSIDPRAAAVGTATHVAVLEPERFTRDVIASPKFDRRTRDGKAAAEAFAEQSAGRLVIDADEYETVQRMADSVRAHPAASALLAAGAAEVSLFWTDPATETPCKARLDWLRPDLGIVDLKTTRDASPREFSRAIALHGYAIQAAHYERGARAVLGVDTLPYWVFVAVEKAPPYAVAVYELDRASINRAHDQVNAALVRYAECVAAARWPAYSDSIEPISLPAWAL